jgi:hypothetical protein
VQDLENEPNITLKMSRIVRNMFNFEFERSVITIIIGNDWYIFSNPELNTFLTILDADEVISGSFSGFCTYLLRRSYLQKCF